MKLFLDARYTKVDGFHDGISRYSVELFKAFLGLPDVKSGKLKIFLLICDDRQKKWFTEHRKNSAKNIRFLKIHAPTSIKEPFTAFVLNRHEPDVVFSPMQTIGSMGRRYKLILTLHDLIYYRRRTPPSQFNPLIRAGWWLYHATYIPQRIALNGADIVATVSYTSKQGIINARLTKRPVIVTRNASQNLQHLLNDTQKAHLNATNLTEKDGPINLIYMGSFMPYKNVETLIEGMTHLTDYTLHLLSRISPTRRTELELLIPSGARVVFHNGVTDQKYAELLSNRAILVSASFDEGYGIPVADAIALGVPAVITDMPIFHEVAGEGALYFDPSNPADFAQKVKKASYLTNYKELSAKGKVQSRAFSWRTSAKVLLDTAQDLIK